MPQYYCRVRVLDTFGSEPLGCYNYVFNISLLVFNVFLIIFIFMLNTFLLVFLEIFNATDYMPEDTYPYFRRWNFQVIM